MNEFSLINHFFKNATKQRRDVLLGIGDDAALLCVPNDQTLVVAIDTLVAGVHFPISTEPSDLGYKALAVNLSDLAAMGATPAWATLALTMPQADQEWLTEFARGFFELADQYNIQLVGGDTTHGPLTITVQIHGFVSADKVLRRDQAKAGDLIFVTGTLGDAGLALRMIQDAEDKLASGTKSILGNNANNSRPENIKSKEENNTINLNTADIKLNKFLSQRLHRPTPRIEEGLALLDLSHCAIDISDGLSADLGHILTASNLGAILCVEDLPLSLTLLQTMSREQGWELALNSGDDYELCFTISPQNIKTFEKKFNAMNYSYHCIGVIDKTPGLRLQHKNGEPCKIELSGYQHFL